MTNSPLAGCIALAVTCTLAGCAAAPPAPDARVHEAGPAAPLAPSDPIALDVARALGVDAARVELTLDPALQAITREELDRLAREWQPAAAVAVVLEPSTGAVLAMAGRDGDRDAPLLAAERAWITGSTLKTILFAAALDAGAVKPGQRFSCGNGKRLYGDKELHDPRAFDELDIAEILATSSNVGATRVFDALGLAPFMAALRRMHFDAALPIQVTRPFRGSIPEPPDERSFEAGLLANGEAMAASPLHVAAAYAAIANEGTYQAPTLVRRAPEGGGGARGASPERVLRAETTRTLLPMLEEVVYGARGTGTAARVDGVRVAGKTGTAAWEVAGRERAYASFVGFAPAERPRFVVLVGAEQPRDGAPGGKVAGPVFARIVARALAR